ncbi:hypothetical protein POSPLADRAFT_1146063 [Postia placenta MAD-698-R-SB12]|uniref:Uncharacterized protein n=1 Tax=Postia placenta MAD-698-R-SB12 TaxID=670580 RepID=A0A1X6MXD3_9APHY|nr:hypothetical protein POSPLADRAFT_1146063 [Postia placenta MAD-698-R-SB12]OSX61024.1 hypothetical protein POSPLADRAFT_1146063 [Postia placenta MAD-698-R-SB12]
MSSICSTSVARLSASSHMVNVSSSILQSPYPEQSAGPLNSAENSAASLASSTCAAASLSRLPKQALSAVAKATSFAKGVMIPWVPNCTDTSWAKKGVAQVRVSPSRRLKATCTLSSMVANNVLTSQYMQSWDRNQSHSMTVFPSYWRGSRSLSVSLSGGDAGDDITSDEGDGGLPAGEDGCCDCPPGELREERVLEQPRGGDSGGGDGGMSFVGSDGPRSAIRARLPITNEERSSGSVALWVVVGDVDLLLGVECVLESRAVEEFVSHGDGGGKGRCACYERPY